MQMKKSLFALVTLAVLIGLFVLFRPVRTEKVPASPQYCESENGSDEQISDASRTRTADRVSVRHRAKIESESSGSDGSDADPENDKRTPEERSLAADIERALDEEDFELAKKCAPLALVCKDAEIRQSMVDTLSWFGEKAIPELTPFIADPDEDVAESAMSEWDSSVSSIDDEAEKIGAVELGLQVITDEDALESISSEYIGVDEKLAVESLLKVIESGGNAKGIAKAKETYEFITGEEFADRAAAEKWIAEEYEPPDPE